MNDITINNETKYKSTSFLKSLLEFALKKQGVENSFVSVILVDENKIRTLNKEYRGLDKVTDSLSFAFEEESNIVYNDIRVLGDIYICIPRMLEQAEMYGHSEKRELAFLSIHGLLHLLGYDHLEKRDEETMFSIQEEILNEYGIKRQG